jgi:putative transposase
MARRQRIVAPGAPHHVVQRGARSQAVFFADHDYAAYLDRLVAQCRIAGCAIWGYCLMPNHVHLILVPDDPDGLRAALAPTHRAHSLRINRREGWHGHLWQERFHSFVMDEPHLLSAARYVERNPVRAGLVRAPEDWRWSSARAHLQGQSDAAVDVAPLLALVPDWQGYLAIEEPPGELEALRGHVTGGRPLGSESFVERLQARAGFTFQRRKPGPKAKAKAPAA